MESNAISGVPAQLGRYEVVGLLATGGMAEILLARIRGPSGFQRPVVIKRILPHLARLEEFREMFLDEARLVARINHENVVQVHELGSEGNELFLVMEYLEGESAGGLIRRLASRGEALEPWLGAHIVAEACAGLQAAHELRDDAGKPLQLVHRDVSPQNLFVTYSGSAKLLDFGIAKATDRSTKTATGQIKGKFQYMSPEQCQSEPIDRRSDIFSLGTVLYELTTGRRLFKRDNELLTFQAICQEPVTFPSRVMQGYPAALEPIVLRALARRPEDRYQTAAEMRQDLLAAIREIDDSRDPRAELGNLMSREFSERVTDKREMLRKIGGGGESERLPPAEVDEAVDVPAVTDLASTVRVVPLSGHSAVPRKQGRWGWVALAVAVAAGGGLFVAARADRGAESATATSAPASETPPPAAAEAMLRIVSTPAGASVTVNGENRGRTPNSVPVSKGGRVTVEVSLEGYEPVAREVAVDENQTLDLALRPVREPNSKTESTVGSAVPPNAEARAAPRPARAPVPAPRAAPSSAPAPRPAPATPPPRASASDVSVPKW
ncbi:MAG: serine/threonine-protein kinase [Polyangiaceae bacterium]